jgi:hypothetical protein
MTLLALEGKVDCPMRAANLHGSVERTTYRITRPPSALAPPIGTGRSTRAHIPGLPQ